MSRLLSALAVAFALAGCTSGQPTAPTPFPSPIRTPTPQLFLPANVVSTSDTPTFSCATGTCYTLTFAVTNAGAGCATNTRVITRAYDRDGNGIQLGADIPMGLPDSSLATFLFRPGVTVTLQNIAPFNDVRSAHTAFRSTITWVDTQCP